MPKFEHEMARNRAKRRRPHAPVSQAKAKEIMRHGEAGGRKLTRKQKGLFGLIAGGGTPTRMRRS